MDEVGIEKIDNAALKGRFISALKPIGKLAMIGLWLGTTVFGGIVSCYPLVRAKFVELKWAKEEEVDGLYALSFFFPGVPFLNFWGILAARTGGIFGAFVAQICLVLPAFVIVLAVPLSLKIPFIYTHKSVFFNGAIWGTTGILMNAGVDNLFKVKSTPLRLIFLVSLILLFMKVPILALIILGTLLGAFIVPITTSTPKTENKGKN